MAKERAPQTRRRVLITGLGPMTAYGMGIKTLWQAMLEGRSAIKPISRFDASGFPCKVAAEVNDDEFNVKKIVPKSYRKATKVMARDIELAVGAAAAAIEDAGLTTKASDPDATPTIDPARMGAHIGAGLIAADADELTAALWTSRDETGRFDPRHWGSTGMYELTPLWLLKYLPNMLACHVTIIHDCQGPSNTITCAESSSILSLGESMRVIQRGAADACLSGGAESKLNPMTYARQHFAGRLAETSANGDAAKVVRPFDPTASGSVAGEGGGLLVVESDESANARGAKVYAELAGFAATQAFCRDTVGMQIEPDESSLVDAIEIALSNAGIAAPDIDAIAPFGSSIRVVDEAEGAAIRRVFGERAASIPLITTVPFVGNCGAGASALSLIAAAKAIADQKLPARLNTQNAEGLDANESPGGAAELKHVLVVSTSLGGQNAAVVLKHAG